MKILITTTLLITSVLMFTLGAYNETLAGEAKATFTVHCYTVGEHALKDQPGVISVEPGWRDFREVDRVVYDPDKISVEQMEDILRKADTYVGTVEVVDNASRKWK